MTDKTNPPMPKGYFSVTIYTKPYLKKYLETMYGNPVYFTTKNYFGMSVAALLERPVQFQHKKDILRQRTDKYTEKMEIHCPKSFLKYGRFGHSISDKQTISLNKLFESKFIEYVYMFTLVMNIAGVETKDALEEICKNFSIEIDKDITMEAILKKEYRFRKKREDSTSQLSVENFTIIQQKLF